LIPVIVLDKDRQISAILAQILSRSTTVGPVQAVEGWDGLTRSLGSQMRSVVVLGPSMDEADLKASSGVARSHAGTAFVHVTDSVDVDRLQVAMRFGIREVIAVQNSEAELLSAVERAHSVTTAAINAVPPPRNDARGKVVAVFSTKGGTGKTVVATNLAVLAAKSGLRTALFDASVWFGDCAAFLRVRPERTLGDLAGISGPIEEDAFRSVLTRHDSGLQLICAPNDAFDAEKLDGSLLTRALQGLRRSFDIVFVDTAPALDQFTLAVLAECDLAYAVATLELPAVKDAKVLLAISRNLGIDLAKLRIILNRADSKVGFPPSEVSRALGRGFAAELPSDIAVPRAINGGVAVALDSPKSKISKSLSKLSEELRAELIGVRPSGRRSSLVARARTAES